MPAPFINPPSDDRTQISLKHENLTLIDGDEFEREGDGDWKRLRILLRFRICIPSTLIFPSHIKKKEELFFSVVLIMTLLLHNREHLSIETIEGLSGLNNLGCISEVEFRNVIIGSSEVYCTRDIIAATSLILPT